MRNLDAQIAQIHERAKVKKAAMLRRRKIGAVLCGLALSLLAVSVMLRPSDRLPLVSTTPTTVSPASTDGYTVPTVVTTTDDGDTTTSAVTTVPSASESSTATTTRPSQNGTTDIGQMIPIKPNISAATTTRPPVSTTILLPPTTTIPPTTTTTDWGCQGGDPGDSGVLGDGTSHNPSVGPTHTTTYTAVTITTTTTTRDPAHDHVITLSASDAFASIGERVTVDVSISEDHRAIAGQILVRYDPSLLRLERVCDDEDNPFFEDIDRGIFGSKYTWSFNGFTEGLGRFTFMTLSSKPSTTGGAIFRLTFTVLPGAENGARVTLDTSGIYSLKDGEEIKATVNCGYGLIAVGTRL